MTTSAELTESAKRYLGSDAPERVIAADARCRAWRVFAPHTSGERAGHAQDRLTVEAWQATRKPCDLPGADPMGDAADHDVCPVAVSP